jgi:hypothetical protein
MNKLSDGTTSISVGLLFSSQFTNMEQDSWIIDTGITQYQCSHFLHHAVSIKMKQDVNK